MIKITFCLVRLPHLTRIEFQQYWRETHANLVQERADVLKIRKYVQNHTRNDDEFRWLLNSRKSPSTYDGVAELWWDSMADVATRDPKAIAASAELLEDEKNFIDLAKSPIFLTDEVKFTFH